MYTKVWPPKAQEDDELSPPRRRVATADHFSPLRRDDTFSSRKRYPRDDNGSTSPKRQYRLLPFHRRNDRHSRQESSLSSTHCCQTKGEPSLSSTYRRSKQESSPLPSQPAKSKHDV